MLRIIGQGLSKWFAEAGGNLASQPVATSGVMNCRARRCFGSTMVFECSEGMRRGAACEQEWCVDAPAKGVKVAVCRGSRALQPEDRR
jgi:hypothetical protein